MWFILIGEAVSVVLGEGELNGHFGEKDTSFQLSTINRYFSALH